MNSSWPGALRVQTMTELFAREIATWTYPEKWSIYDPSPDDLLTPEAGYVAVVGVQTALVGFACSGTEARVPGLLEKPSALDIGFGMSPIFAGQNHGAEFATAIVSHFQAITKASHLRVVVQSWNERSLRLTRNLGFEDIGIHECEQNGLLVTYAVLQKALD